MRTPAHLKGLIGALTALDKACEDTEYEWFLKWDRGGYTIQIYSNPAGFALHRAKTPAEAISRALIDFNLRIRKKP